MTLEKKIRYKTLAHNPNTQHT